ncbi:Protocatechuate 3,4-dioxygenase beta subunit [Amycolatopsis marina]|uniref:Protocatechuate 3,4-dioxygenase beta subunit n=1 Tax=Amycolatopsis marina TaxID=490629 RepID=A0A1I1APT9_9PSEU|nr:dioxygenase [Amycolatopsis marina]SFB38353.1 Protocatechuate 3,4-dioxygenase beta subunit [Amycolatopsis marina]
MTDEKATPQEEVQNGPKSIDRKHFLHLAAAAATLPAIALTTAATAGATGATTEHTKPSSLEPTPECDDGDDPTPPQTEGPYFKPNSPARRSLLEPGIHGTVLTVTGRIFAARTCLPLERVLLDFWQCDASGVYDNRGYRLRGHQYTNPNGDFSLTTIWPGLYPGRTRHIHVKVQAPYQRILTTQLYFPGEPRNPRDPIFDSRLLMEISNNPDGTRNGAFDFVLNV